MDKQLLDFKFDILLIDEAYQVNYDEPDCHTCKSSPSCSARNPKLIIIGYGDHFIAVPIPSLVKFWNRNLFLLNGEGLILVTVRRLFGFGQGDTEYKDFETIPSGQDGTKDLSKRADGCPE